MPKLQAKYVPIGTKLEEPKIDNGGKSMKELEAEAKAKNSRIGTLGKSKEEKVTPLVAIQKEKVKPLVAIHLEEVKPLVDIKPKIPTLPALEKQAKIEEIEIELAKLRVQKEEEDLFDNLFLGDFLSELNEVEHQVETGIESGAIKLLVTNADRNMHNINDAFDTAVSDVFGNVNYQVRDEKKVAYSRLLNQALTKLDKLERSIDHETYHNELMVTEMEDNMLRQSRYRKRKLEGLDDIGIEGRDHKTSEQQTEIDLMRNTDFSSDFDERRQGREEGYVEHREFKQDYAGSDLEGIDKERDKLEKEILKKQEAEEKKNKKNRNKKTEEQKIAEAKENLRKKQEKRKAKQEKRTKAEDVAEIDLVGNQFDVEELREEKMDRLLEIKKLSAEKKELQKQKEKQRSKATKEFYKYKKVNKKSHIVGFKQ